MPARPRSGLLPLCAALVALSASVAIAEAQAPARRTTAVNVLFEVPKQVGTNIDAQPSSESGFGVDVYAGVTYTQFSILADSDLGFDATKVRMKLVVFDIRAEKKDCPDIEPFDWALPPFDGSETEISGWATMPPDETKNSWSGAMFPRAGKYRICYKSGIPGTNWYLLGDANGPGVFVMGALSRYEGEVKVWCPLQPMQVYWKFASVCLEDPTLLGCQCKGKVAGQKRRQDNPYELMNLGLPDPAEPEWRVFVTNMDEVCGIGGGADPNPLEVGTLPDGYDGYQRVTNYQGYEVHNFGKVYNPQPTAATFDTAVGTWKLCYCPGLAMDGMGENCSLSQQEDYPQEIGRLIIISIITTDYNVAVYPTLRFELYICCGSTACMGTNNGYGGCSEVVGDPRYKIVRQEPQNNYMYYESEAGCRTASQLDTYAAGSKIIGGHLGPDNCVGQVDCRQEPYRPEDCSYGVPCAEQRKKPTFKEVQVDASYDNSVMMRQDFDVCYCDSECTNPLNWLKAGAITSFPMNLEFQEMISNPTPQKVPQIELGLPSTGNILQFGSVVVNTPVWIIIKGSDAYGLWSTESSPDAELTREMKILRDECGRPDRPCEMKRKCLGEEQPNVVNGHRLKSGNTDYTEPITLRATPGDVPRGQRYGSACDSTNMCQPAIEIADAGWYAVCYCDSNCNEEANWLMVGREMVSGPFQGQTWRRYTETTFSINIKGWGMNNQNKMRLLSPNEDLAFCGQDSPATPGVEYAMTDRGHGPAGKAYTWGRTEASNSIIEEMVYDPEGTKLVFQKTHGLKDGDWIRLQEVRVEKTTVDPTDVFKASQTEKMYASSHQVTFGCDRAGTSATKCHEVSIPVSFLPSEFPYMPNPTSIGWFRDSEERFDNIRIRYGYPSPEGRGYKLCWAANEESRHVGQVGEMRVDDPMPMEARLGLTTVQPMAGEVGGHGSPMVVYFKTGSFARYEQAEGPMHIYISIMPGNPEGVLTDWSQVLEPLDYQLNLVDSSTASSYLTWDTASQIFCGQIFLEMWSEDADGFPMPDGCYFNTDTVHDGRPEVKEIHMRFAPRNHLKKETRYMVVLNMNIIKYAQAKWVLDADYPTTGAVWVWSMDEYDNDPYTVIEMGQARVGELDKRVPPRNPDNTVLVLSDQFDDPRFHTEDGFKIVAADGTNTAGEQVWALNSYCISSNGNLNTPKATNKGGFACMPCVTEEDCGNGNEFLAPNMDYSWCQSPIDIKCIEGEEVSLLDVPSFYFNIRAAIGAKIQRLDILRIFLHPLTQWDLQSCKVAWNGDDGCPGNCDEPSCIVEMVVAGIPTGIPEYPMNIMHIALPSSMGGEFTADNEAKFVVANTNLPSGGFTPGLLSAELMDPSKVKPDYWPHYRPSLVGMYLYKKPKIFSASMVTNLGDGNQYPFMEDPEVSDYPFNTLYIRLAFGATLFAKSGESIRFEFTLPLESGYACMPESVQGEAVPQLAILSEQFPSTQGKLHGGIEVTGVDNPFRCRVKLLQGMRLYASSVVFIALRVRNPQKPLKYDDPTNIWNLELMGQSSDTWFGMLDTDEGKLSTVLSNVGTMPCPGLFAGVPRDRYFCKYPLPLGFDGKVAVLGKITNLLISPSNFGVNNVNTLLIFFRCKQMVGSLSIVQTEIWVDAPSQFEFGKYCAADHLDDFYYIPEGAGTMKLPMGSVFVCHGEPRSEEERTFNRAKITTTGRLLPEGFYGFQVDVTNPPLYMRNQQVSVLPYQEPWTVSTYQRTVDTYWDGEPILNPVDGSFYTAKFNEESPEFKSFGVFLRTMPSRNFGVSFADMRPTPPGGEPTSITVLPIIVSIPMRRATRIIAPTGYVWDFEQVEFRYKRRAPGVLESLIVDGVEADMPLSGVPARPVAAPQNELTIDYMQGAWAPGTIYGFASKIRIPYVPPTSSANQFTIEFGYNEILNDNRLEAGVTGIPLVKSLINGGVSYTTSIKNRSVTMTFSVRTVSSIETAGGLLISGPASFKFDRHCQPKALPGYPDFPPDITCLAETIDSTGIPEVSIYAGALGIPPAHYMFTMEAQNPPQAYIENLGEWMFQTFDQMSQRIVLDGKTVIPGYMINDRMGGLDVEHAAMLRNPPWEFCQVLTEEQSVQFGVQRTQCDFENWQFWPGLGGKRDDRPNLPSGLMIRMILMNAVDREFELVVTAPKGYLFDSDCKVAAWPSASVFDSTVTIERILAGKALWVSPQETWHRIPIDGPGGAGVAENYILEEWRVPPLRSMNQRYSVWPDPGATQGGAEVLGCKGHLNTAKITLDKGLQAGGKGYIFRLDVLRNPPETPIPNTFTLEYAGEASETFEGVEIWAFTNITIVPTTTAASTDSRSTWNLVTITFKPVNDQPHGGHLRITAPPEFLVPTSCEITLETHPDIYINKTALEPPDLEWAEFLPGDVPCEGDVTASNRARLLFTKNQKRLKSQMVYKMTLMIRNPEITSPYKDPWVFESFKGLTVNEGLDSATAEGFTINSPVEAFAFLRPSSYNAHVKQRIDFNMSFPETVALGHTIQIVAPISYTFSERGSNECPQYNYIQGSLRRTAPLCGANMMWWTLQEEMVPAGDVIRFMVQVKNPDDTPDVNLFQLRQLDQGGVRLSSRMIEGYEIIPELVNMTITKAETLPLGQCRETVRIAATSPCHAVGSSGAFVLEFIPVRGAQLVKIQGRVLNDHFNFEEAIFNEPIGRVMVPEARSATAILARMQIYEGMPFSLRVDKVLHPSLKGMSLFDITTYTDDFPMQPTVMPVLTCSEDNGPCGTFPPATARRDEKNNQEAFPVLSYMHVASSSRVNPIFYSTPRGTVTFEIRSTHQFETGEVLRITRPPGYAMFDKSLLALSSCRFEPDHGVDRKRVWSASYSNPEDYYGIFSQPVLAETSMAFSFESSLPDEAFPAPFWIMRSYFIHPLRDVDGEILNSTQPHYPWIGRPREQKGTNDGAFPDFLLVGPIPFTVVPQLQTPGAFTEIRFSFDLAQQVSATDDIKVDLTGPLGFQFENACFSKTSPNNPAFVKCVGNRHKASLVTLTSTLGGYGILVVLVAYNPRITPPNNMWSAAVFTDDPNQYVRWSEQFSYEIVGMPVVYKGNNQLGESASGFFTFTPVRPSPSPKVSFEIRPPPDSGFRIFCTGISPLGFLRMPQCVSGGVNEPLTLTFRNASLMEGYAYTFGIQVYNPGGRPSADNNYWGLSIKDHSSSTFDANLDIPGLELGTVPIRVYGIGWTSAEQKVMAKIMIQLRVLHDIPAGSMTEIWIQAPTGIMFSEDMSSIRVIPLPLPLRVGMPTAIAGDVLILKIDQQRLIKAAMYNIRFEVINPTIYPHDNTWSFLVKRNIDIEFSHVLTGYVPGMISPYDVTLAQGAQATAGGIRSARPPATGLLTLLVFLPALLTLLPSEESLWGRGLSRAHAVGCIPV